MGGVVSGSKVLINKIEHAQNWLGGLLRPMDAFLGTQVKTLPLRMQKHFYSAQMIAEFLQSHPAVEKVYWLVNMESPSEIGANERVWGYDGYRLERRLCSSNV